MGLFKVSQVRDTRIGEEIKSRTVTADRVSATRAELRQGMRNDPAASSDTIQVRRA